MGAAWHQPSCSLRQRPPAATVMACSFSGRPALHRPLGVPQPVQLRRQRPGAVLQILQVAAAVERPPIGTAGPAAPIAGLRGARTSVVGLGPAAAIASLVDPRARGEGDLPGPTSLPAAHQVSPPLACLSGSDQPTKQAGTAKPEPHRGTTVLPASLLAVLIRDPVRGSGLKAGPDEAGAVSNPGPAAAESLVKLLAGQAGPGEADRGRARSLVSAALTGSWSSRCAPVRVASAALAPAPPTATVVWWARSAMASAWAAKGSGPVPIATPSGRAPVANTTVPVTDAPLVTAAGAAAGRHQAAAAGRTGSGATWSIGSPYRELDTSACDA
jgi:hypothetical protein